MIFEQVGSVYSIVINLAGLIVCLFQYIKRPTKVGVCVLVYLLSNLLSNYYWGAYVVVMGDYPNVSSILSYVGWNIAFLTTALMPIILIKENRIKFFSPLSLIPVPLNIAQLLIYLQYGGYFNNIWQVFFSTVTVCLSINYILCYVFRHKKEENLRKPYIEVVLLLFITSEYISWTSSCYSWSTEWVDPYTYASIFSGMIYILLPIAISKTYNIKGGKKYETGNRLNKIFAPVYFAFVFTTCFGGYILAVWMKKTLTSGIGQVGDTDPYSVIAVMLFVVSLVIILFTITVILIVSSEQKTSESRKLKIEKSAAERSNAAKSEFLANMSHEIRTPINAVLGMNEMILRESLEARDMLPQEREEIIKIFSDICNYSGNIESAGNNLLSIINDILDFSKIEAGKMELVESNYKLSSVLNDVSNMISFKAKSKNLEYIVEVDETLPDGLYGDEVRVRQIITNLLNNAVKYTQKGSICLSVNEGKSEYNDFANLVVKVKDTGIGIKEEDISKLFNKFERVDMKNNSTVEGTGLGLAITGSLLTMMGGDIKVESEYGKGSVFSVSIPQKIVSEEPIGNFREKFEKSISALKAPKENFHAPNAHILIVDDTVMNLTVARGLLKNTYINIDTAVSGEEAIELSKANCYDVILMDQRMPNMDGITAMHYIKEDANCINASTPFICLTADAVSGARERYLSEGFEDYITKPIDSRELLDTLLKYLPQDKIKRGDMPREKSADAVNDISVSETEAVKDISVSKTDADSIINRKTGIDFCGGDEEFYDTLLDEYVKESEKKSLLIEELFEKQDWKNYSVQVHSLKSTSKMIGAAKLSEIAAEVEKASDESDAQLIRTKHDKMCGMYRSVTEEIRKLLDIKESNPDKKDEDEILEFLPE
ncbi:MAG: response regulator [Lachnospiraceae bacterium]|nr:response regulator [Lachnospiraceae bacterium]